MEKIRVGLGERAYDIAIGTGVLDAPQLLLPHVAGRRVAIVTNEIVGPLYLGRVQGALAEAGGMSSALVIPDGEGTKNWETLKRVLDWLLGDGFARDSVVVALGGGVIGDLAGFAAAVFQRGIAYVQVPTTLLAQVDSAVGGKTGINHARGKNLIGAFHQPRLVLADVGSLDSLPERELRAGLAEVIKYGFALDAGFCGWLERHLERILARDVEALTYVVRRCCELKADVVAADERESGPRALLNLGHTFAHAVETALGHGVWLHGEAVAAGMVMAGELSRRLGLFGGEAPARLRRLLERAGLPVRIPEMPVERVFEHMQSDKKVERGRLRFVVLTGVGSAVLRSDVDAAEVRSVIQSAMF